ncbi:MAG: M1 family metallopeptidase [Chloroflexota bacterium]|nr:MAG: M1 family metallopeptidase [Chloroflexota bacterium]
MKRQLAVFILTSCLGLSILGCSTQEQVPLSTNSGANTPETATPTAEQPITTTPPPATPTNAPDEPGFQLTKYVIDVELNYDAHSAVVDQRITYVNNSNSELEDLLFLIEPNSYPNGFLLNAITWENDNPIQDYSLNGRELRLVLPQSLEPESTVGITLSFQLNLPNQNAPYGYTERQTNLGDWYPYLPPYIPGEGWLVREDAFLGEHLAYEMSEFEVEIKLTNPYSANGGELVLAASSIPEREGDSYQYHHSPARNFAWTVSDQYLEQETQVGAVLVKSYAFPFHPQAEAPALEETAKALSIFSELFEPYPHKALSVVEADFLDGMEYDGLVFLSHAFYDYYTGDPQSNLTIIAAHEVAHQWWYGLVGNDQAREPWLDEALSTFSEIFFYERAYPEFVDWWWENRIYFHDPQGWVDSTIYEAAGFYPYRDAVYLRGALFLSDLRNLLGEEVFIAFLRDYLAEYRYRQATGDDFFNLLSAYASEADLSALINSYFSHRSG